MNSVLHKRPAKQRYVVVYDSFDDDKIYGTMKIDTKGIRTSIELQFFNDDGRIDLSVREISKVEWETMNAFELFPILTPYHYDPKIRMPSGWHPYGGPIREKHKVVIFKVRFRDY
jgi:hypothetical protein